MLTKAGVPVTLGSRAVAVCKLGARAQDRNLAGSHLHRLDRGVFAKVSRCALDDRFEANRDLVTAVCLWPVSDIHPANLNACSRGEADGK